MAWKTLAQSVDEFHHYVSSVRKGDISVVQLPFDILNKAYFNGLGWGWIVTIGGMPGSGKTAAIIHIMDEILTINKDRIVSRFYSFEMPAKFIAARIMSKHVKVSVQNFFPDNEYSIGDESFQRYSNAIKEYSKDRHFFIEDAVLSIGQIEKDIHRFAEINKIPKQGLGPYPYKNTIGMIIGLDHSLLTKGMGEDKTSLSSLYSLANRIVKTYPKTIWFILSQFNRNIDDPSRKSKLKPTLHYPTTSDIYGGSAAEQFSDIIWAIHNPAKLLIEKYGPRKMPTKSFIFFHQLKSRHTKGFGPDPIQFRKEDLAYSMLNPKVGEI